MQSFYSKGKLLLTGEYVVLDGALALATPTRFGQYLRVSTTKSKILVWKSYDEKNSVWFECSFTLKRDKIIPQTIHDVSLRLAQILNVAKSLNHNFLDKLSGLEITTRLEFSRFWGLGTSSTLIYNIASWANVDPYELLHRSFGGSGYDIACAQSESAITYQLIGDNRHITPITFNPEFKNNLFFVHLNKKQDSRKGISKYNLNKNDIQLEISKISEITTKILACSSLKEFEELISEHENIISAIVKTKPVKELLFSDYQGAIKSLGAWGGDFILVTGTSDNMDYFRKKGYQTIMSFDEMVV